MARLRVGKEQAGMNEMPTFQEEDYIKLLETLIKVAEANKGTALGEDDRFLDAEGLCKKFMGHAASALYLFESTTLPNIKVTDRRMKMLKSSLTNGFILELFSRITFKHSVNVISNVAKRIKNQGIKNDNLG